jgi:hypothetical protein
MFFVLVKAFLHHFHTEEEEQSEGNPMVELFDEAVEPARAEPSDEGHDSLEETEEESHCQERAPTDAAQDDATGDGYRKTVHRQTYGQ